MPNYRRSIGVAGPGTPPISALIGGALAKKDRVMSAYANVNELPTLFGRVIGRVGVHGAEHFQILSDDPVSPDQIYPLKADEREVMRLKWSMTPGTGVIVRALFAPCGSTNKYVAEPGSWIGDTPGGEVIIEATFTRPGDVYTASTTLPFLVVSPEEFAGEAQGPGAIWSTLRTAEAELRPYDWGDTADEHKGSDGVTCELLVKYQGGVRVVDLVVSETAATPYVRDIGTDAPADYMRAMTVDGTGKPVKTYPRDYPVSALTATDPTYGTELLQDIVDRQHRELGPILAQHSSWDESTQSVTSLEVAPITIVGTDFQAILHPGLDRWSANYPGWSMSAGGQAQQFRSSSSTRITRDKNACVPVRIWVRCWRTGSTAATLRFQSENYSVAELTVATDAKIWRSCTGHMRCGLGPEDPSVLMMFGKCGAGIFDALHVSDLVVEYADI